MRKLKTLSPYPEHDKLANNDAEHKAISEFLEFLVAQDINFTKHHAVGGFAGHYHHYRPEELIALYFGIDRNALEAEKLSMLAVLATARGNLPQRA